MLKLERVSKSYGALRAVDGASFDVPEGEVTVLAGADGAGKSTLLRMLVGLVRPDEGRILLDGRETEGGGARVASVAGYMPERFSLYLDLSVEENLNFFADVHGVGRKRREEMKRRLLERTGMEPFRRRRAGALSGGMKQKLALSAMLLASPRLLLLDEPTTGVDPLSRIEFYDIIRELKAEGRTVLMATPYLAEAEKGDRVVFLKQGRVILEETIARLRKNFPARVFRVLPRENVFEALRRVEERGKEEGRRIHLHGRYLRVMVGEGEDPARLVPALSVEEEKPTLEDMYLFYERRA
ncbi:MAG: ABC transporter ATP-binding protein [Candidatus Aminicenantes bacterium]|nr:ABC transporter ATP-binding protein [Candidatus Aminicenantes bacterium]